MSKEDQRSVRNYIHVCKEVASKNLQNELGVIPSPAQTNELAAARAELKAVKNKMVEFYEANKKLKAENSNLIKQLGTVRSSRTSTAASSVNRTSSVNNNAAVASGGSTSVSSSAVAVVDSGKTYTVQSGDNLTKISRKVFNDTKHVNQIRELNQDILKGKDNLKIGWVLKMPAK